MRNVFMVFIIAFVFSACTKLPSIETKIDSIFSEFTSQTPGASVLVWQNGKTIFAKGYGLANLESKTPIVPKSNFRLASITKQFTAFSILLLEEEGLLSLDDTLPKFFLNFPEYGKDISVKQILQHTSGLQAYENFIDDTVTVQLKDRDVLRILMERDSTYFKPGTEHRYSNSGYALLAMLIEKLSGKTFAQFLHDRIFVPLEMTNSVAFENGISVLHNRAFGYAKTDSGFIDTDQSLTSAVLGDGGIYSSTLEMVKWNNEIDNPTLLPKKKLNLAFKKLVLPNSDVINYGFGWRLDPYRGFERPYHTGGTSGFSNIFMKIPELDLAVIVLINIREYDAKGYAEKVSDIFIDLKK